MNDRASMRVHANVEGDDGMGQPPPLTGHVRSANSSPAWHITPHPVHTWVIVEPRGAASRQR